MPTAAANLQNLNLASAILASVHSVLPLPWDGNERFAQLGARLMSAPCCRRNFATSRFRLEQATSSAMLPPAIVLGETPLVIRSFASGNLPSAAAIIRKLVP